jgi:oligopeptide/dipeptide ABC transporter ATP-binding protein
MNRDIDNQRLLLDIRNLSKHYNIRNNFFKMQALKAIDNVSFGIYHGETLGIVGESGCGKTTLGRTLLRLEEPTTGEVFFQGLDIARLPQSKLKQVRSSMQIIFQDPFSSLSPRFKIWEIISEPLYCSGMRSRKKRREKAVELLNFVGLDESVLDRYPHQFSGGQRQRIGFSRALANKPSFIVCDEPVSSLDVSIQAQVLNLLSDIQSKFELTYLFISHDLSVVKHISNRIGVMYLGKIVELTSNDSLFNQPCHPYTNALLSAIPDPWIEKKRIILQGDVPNPICLPIGCNFHPRCYMTGSLCREEEPKLRLVKDGHYVACHYAEKLIEKPLFHI